RRGPGGFRPARRTPPVESTGAFPETGWPPTHRTPPMRPCLTVLLLLFSALRIATEPVPVDTLWALERLGPFSVSPDGMTVAVTTTQFDLDADVGRSRIRLFDVDGRRPARPVPASGGSDTRPAWHPNGRQLFFLGAPKGKPTQLYRA